MEIKVSGKHLEITDAIKDYAVNKAAKLPRYFDRVQSIEIIGDRVAETFEVEIIVEVEHHDSFVARAKGGDLYACIDEVVDKIERQLTDHKGKLRNRKHPG